jgi:hypothetical protein
MMGLILATLTAALAEAAMIHGIVIEQATSRPVARATVRLQTVVGGELRTLSTALTNRSGQYWFPSLEDGRYFVAAHRSTYFEMQHGQRRPRGRGEPIVIKGAETAFAEIRLRKLGAIMGKLTDDNRVALPEINVIAYPAKLPLVQAATAKSDDRGVFRLAGLPPGNYWVRTAAKELEDGTGLLPTFFPMTTEAKDAKIYSVELDADLIDLEMQPLPGKLIKLRGNVAGCPPQERFLRVTLAFDSGRRETNAPCPLGPFSFDGLAPAAYEILAAPGTSTQVSVAAYEEAFFDRDAVVNLQLTELPVLGVRAERPDQGQIKPGEFTVRLRRRDLAGAGDFVPAGNLLPGYYELFFQTSGSNYVQQVSLFPDRKRIMSNQPPGLAPVVHLPQSGRASVTVRVSSQAAAVEGVVKQQGRISIFAPVYLHPMDADLSRRMNGSRAAYTDEAGRFRFAGIAPGRYWIISTMDLEEISNATLEHARASELLLQEGGTKQIELTMYEVR